MEITVQQLQQHMKDKAALELLRFKAARQMCQGKTTCTIDEKDVQEILYIAGMNINREVEVI
jgi:hypothetical protein